MSERFSAELTDLPGTYSLYPRRTDEWVAYRVLLMDDDTVKPDMILLVADASKFGRPAMIEMASLREVHTLFTDAPLEPSFERLLHEHDVRCVIAQS